jgi:hypothetical protein
MVTFFLYQLQRSVWLNPSSESLAVKTVKQRDDRMMTSVNFVFSGVQRTSASGRYTDAANHGIGAIIKLAQNPPNTL